MAYLSKYGVARKIRIPLIKRAVADHAVSADWTPAAGDVKISKDGGAAANVTNLPTAIAMGNSTVWEFSLTATEMQAAQINVTIGDTATKAVEDDGFDLETYGNASAQHAVDLADAVRFGLTALPNAVAAAAGGLITFGTGAGQLNVSGGRADADALRINALAVAAANLAKATGLYVTGTVTNSSFAPTTTQFEASDITTATADFYVGRRIIGLTGNRTYEAAQITAYSLQGGARGRFTVTTMTGAFANGDTFLVI